MPFPHIYLASRSPRRRELLAQIGVHYRMLLLREHPGRGADINEDPLPGELPEVYVRRVCALKVASAWQRVIERKLAPHPVLAADTTVCVGDEILAFARCGKFGGAFVYHGVAEQWRCGFHARDLPARGAPVRGQRA